MATARLPKPGTELGPCAESCEHRDCAATRRRAAEECGHCGDPIGYDRRFYLDPLGSDDGRYVHAACLEDAVKAGAA